MRAAWRILLRTLREFFEDSAPQLAAAVAFYTVLSLAPLVLLALDLAGRFWGQAATRAALLGQARDLAGPRGAEALQSVLEHAQPPEQVGVGPLFGLGVLLFASTAVFAQLQAALNHMWGAPSGVGWQLGARVRRRLISMSMLLVLGALGLITLGLSAGLSLAQRTITLKLPGSGPLWYGLNLAASLIVFTLLFAAVFKLLPDTRVAWRDVWLGAALTAVLFGLGREGITLYLVRTGAGSAYGAAGALIFVLLWVYYSCLILFLGAEFTHVYAQERTGSEPRA